MKIYILTYSDYCDEHTILFAGVEQNGFAKVIDMTEFFGGIYYEVQVWQDGNSTFCEQITAKNKLSVMAKLKNLQ